MTQSSRLHDKDGVFTVGHCTNYSSIPSVGSYQVVLPTGLCENWYGTANEDNRFINTNSGDTCTYYWNKKIDGDVVDGIDNSTTRSMHWMNGGYFYGSKEFRDYIYDEKGTIHFSTSVKYDVVDSTTSVSIDYIPEFNYFGQNKINTMLPIWQKYSNPTIFKLNPIANSLGFSYEVFNTHGSISVPTLKTNLKYNPITKGFNTILQENTELVYSCGSTTCPSVYFSTVLSNNIMVMLSTGNITHYPLTSEKVVNSPRGAESSQMDSPTMTSFYADVVTPAISVYDSLNNIVGCDISDTSYNSYFINNAFTTPYSMVSTSASITDGSSNYENYKFRCYIYGDEVTDEPYLVLTDDSGLLINQYNERDESELAYTVFDRIVTFMKSNYGDANIHTTLYETTGNETLSTLELIKTTNVLDSGTLYDSHQKEIDPYDARPDQYRIRINLTNKIKNATYINKDTSRLMQINGKQSWLLMLKVSSLITGYRNNTNESVGSVVLENSNTNYKFKPISNLSVITEMSLFNENSSRFSTPDYTSFKVSASTIIPLRGSEYTNIEKENYPKIRYVRKSNGKFYVQILAGAFPYFHSVVHYPAVKELEACPPGSVCNGRTVVDSLASVCSKSSDWYNHVATTKWVCYVKHTEFGNDSSEFLQTESTKQSITGPNEKYVGKTPQSITAVYNPIVPIGTVGIPIAESGGASRPSTHVDY